MKKKILALALVVALVAVMVGGSLAYFTDTDEVTNVFTIGSVKIQIWENGAPTIYPDVKFDKPLNPGNVIDKVVQVANNGHNDAYIRTHIAIPTKLVGYLQMSVSTTGWSDVVVSNAVVGGVEYTVYSYDYLTAVTKDNVTNVLLQSVWMDESVDLAPVGDNGEMEFVKTVDGVTEKSGFKAHVLQSDGTIGSAKINVLVASQAIQADGFDATVENAATKALNTGFGEGTNPWQAN